MNQLKPSRIGRPFNGDVDDQSGKEADVPEKRSVFRLLKKFYGKDRYKHYKKNTILKTIEKDMQILDPSIQEDVNNMLTNFEICKSRSDKSKEGVNYVDIVGDPCYKYAREVKLRFFKNFACSFLFLKALPYLTEEFKKRSNYDEIFF